jgi:glycosyltransferase involved in cell wall biosynthesis
MGAEVESKAEISIVVPLYNEASNLREFFSELDDEIVTHEKVYEVIFVDDGSTDESHKILLDIEKHKTYVKVLSLKKNVGKAGALELGFKLASGDKVIIMDCDLQYDPSDIKALLNKIDEGYDVVSGKRVNRADSGRVKLTSWLFRFVVRKLSGLIFSDYFSGLKCFRVNVIVQLGVYGNLNRIFSVYAHRAGFKVCEIPVIHRPRRHGSSNYNFLSRLRLGLRDLIILFYTVILTREEIYKVGLAGFFFLGFGGLIIVLSVFLLPYEMMKGTFESILLAVGVMFIYIGWQLRVIEVIGKEFLNRHMGAQIFKEHDLRMANVKYVSPDRKKVFNMQRDDVGGSHQYFR